MDHHVGIVWTGGALSFVDVLCLRSFARAGHRVDLIAPEAPVGLPEGVTWRNAREIAPADAGRGLILRSALDAYPGMILAAPDILCRTALATSDGHLHFWKDELRVGLDLLAIPPGSATLAALGTGVLTEEALTAALQQSGEIRATREDPALYSLKDGVDRLLDPSGRRLPKGDAPLSLAGQDVVAALLRDHGGWPDPASALGRLLIDHDIDPGAWPLREGGPDRVAPIGFGGAARAAAQAQRAPAVTEDDVRPLDRVTVVTTMKNEGAFLLDWIAHHLTVGVSHFLVYTNDCEDGTVEILDALAGKGLVTRVDNPAREDERPQRVALAHAATHPAVTGADAVIVMDVDEYIDIHCGDGTLRALFAAAGDPDMISMTWRLFGSGGRTRFEDRPVPEVFRRAAPRYCRKPHQAWGMKTIQRRGVPFRELGVHRPLGHTGGAVTWTNGSGRAMPESYLGDGWRSNKRSWGYDLVTLNHYAVRSAESFLVKHERGRTNHVKRDHGVEYWAVFDRNDEEDAGIAGLWQRARPLADVLKADPALSRLHRGAVGWHRARIAALLAEPSGAALFEQLTGNTPDKVGAPEPQCLPEPQAAPMAVRDEAPPVGSEAEAVYRSLSDRTATRMPVLRPLGDPPASDRVVIVSSMKNEGAFILEWIAYHLSIGVTHFLVYTNDCDDPTDAILDRLQALGLVTRRDNPFNREAGQKPQRGALNDAIQQPVVQDADWIGIIDVDEFVNIHVGDGHFRDLLSAAGDPNVISMTWRFFGNRGVHAYDDVWQTEVLTACAPKFLPKPRLGWGFKSFHRMDAPFSKLGVHRPLDLDPDRRGEVRWVNGSGRVMPDRVVEKAEWFSRKDTIGYDMVTLNHYVLRSAESFLVKRQRGRINHVDQDQGVAYWAARNYATETDKSIHARLPRARGRLAELMADAALAALHAEAVAWHRARIAALMAEPDYRALYDAITAPDLPDAIWRARPPRQDMAAE